MTHTEFHLYIWWSGAEVYAKKEFRATILKFRGLLEIYMQMLRTSISISFSLSFFSMYIHEDTEYVQADFRTP